MRSLSLKPRDLGFLVAGAIVALDQLTKWIVVRTLSDGPVVVVDGFFQLRLIENPGSSFSLFQGAGAVIALIAIGAVALIVVLVARLSSRWEAAALGLVLGGALGNLLDRLFRGPGILDGKVIDFVDFSFFPAFNVADSAITIGAALAVLLAFRQR
ncbi:MAG: signal peptidase II [Actinobacteria bacterium]|nr:signal peptidase II [Actinomycetota bacterium]